MRYKYKFTLLIALVYSLVFQTFVQAQSLPNVQKNSVKLPATAKVDGKPTEWANTFQAYNHSTNVYYTMANNNEKLYLLIKAKDPLIMKKIINGGISLLINKAGLRNSNDNVVITFPLFEKVIQPTLLNDLTDLLSLQPDSINNKTKQDSVTDKINKETAANLKEIEITGIKELPDSLISVYNSAGIKAWVNFDRKSTLTYEFSIPLKLLGISNSSNKLVYNIMLKGLSYNKLREVVRQSPDGPITVTAVPRGLVAGSASNFQSLYSPTDFWGEYILAK